MSTLTTDSWLSAASVILGGPGLVLKAPDQMVQDSCAGQGALAGAGHLAAVMHNAPELLTPECVLRSLHPLCCGVRFLGLLRSLWVV